MIDMCVRWARDYRADGFRFDLMGHHSAATMRAVRDALRAGKVGLGAFVGFIVGTAAKIGCAAAILLTLLGVWLYSLF